MSFITNILPNQAHYKLTESIIFLITGELPYYGEFGLYMNFHESKNANEVPTAGVNVTSNGMNFYWNRNFLDRLEQSDVNFLMIHEECHLLFDHQYRSVGYNLKDSNIVQDMLINQIIYDEIMKKLNGKKINFTIPKDNLGNNSALMVPKEYEGELFFEALYEWFVAKKRKWQKENAEKIKNFRKSETCSNCGKSLSDDPKNNKQKQDQGTK